MLSEYTFSADANRIDRARVHRWLSEQAYWAIGRGRDIQETAIDASRNYGVWDANGDQVAYARVVTDGATFAWLCDVFVDEVARGEGIGKMLVEGVLADLQSLPVSRILLATSTAHGLYAQYGFAVPDDPKRYMVKQLTRAEDQH